MRTSLAAMASMLVLAACQSSSAAPAGPTFVGATLPACGDDSSWRCGTVTVPLDRAHPQAGVITIAFYVQSRVDHTHPALEPVLTTAGGPGGSIWFQRGDYQRRMWELRHDTVLVERRGVGRSGGIACAALQGGVATPTEMWNATSACAAQLGQTADRYGTGDVALDIEAVRHALGLDSFDFYAASYATLAAQAYVVRFPKRVHALVLDSGFAASNMARDLYGTQYVAPTLRVVDVLCSRSAECASAYPHPEQVVDQAIGRLHRGGPVSAMAAWGLAYNLGPAPYGIQPKDYLDALAALLAGHPDRLQALVANEGSPAIAATDPNEFNNGDNVASSCTDEAMYVPWSAGDSFATRQQKLAAAFAAIDPAGYAPLGLTDLEAAAGGTQQCLAWPVASAVEPVVPSGAIYPADLPVLVMSGDIDLDAPTEISRLLLQEFPQGTFVVVAGVGHVSSDPGWGTCGDQVVTTFLERQKANPAACS